MWSAHWKSGPTWGYPPVGRMIDLTLSNGSVPGPIVYVIYKDPHPPGLNVGDQLLDNIQFPPYAGETLFILLFFLEYTILPIWII